MSAPVVLVGVPTALGGHLGGMEATPARLREQGLLGRLPWPVTDAGDVAIEPGFRDDADPRAKNRQLIAAFLPRERQLVAGSLARAGSNARVLVVGGDCTAHAGALAGLAWHRPRERFAIAWFDAHGDYNTPDTTPSGNVWGMPFAMLCGRGSPDLVAACDGPTVDPHRAALLGGQVLDEEESRMLARDGVAQFGAGMLATEAGLAALDGWARAIAREVEGLYVAFDLDAIDPADNVAVQMPEPSGIRLGRAVEAVEVLAAAAPVVGFGATGINLRSEWGAEPTLDAVVRLAIAAFGR